LFPIVVVDCGVGCICRENRREQVAAKKEKAHRKVGGVGKQKNAQEAFHLSSEANLKI
jgi:hypothetical protein